MKPSIVFVYFQKFSTRFQVAPIRLYSSLCVKCSNRTFTDKHDDPIPCIFITSVFVICYNRHMYVCSFFSRTPSLITFDFWIFSPMEEIPDICVQWMSRSHSTIVHSHLKYLSIRCWWLLFSVVMNCFPNNDCRRQFYIFIEHFRIKFNNMVR